MGFMDKIRGGDNKSIEELEEDLEKYKLKSEIAGSKAEIAERQAIIRDLKSKYGSGWKRILGLKGIPSLETLRGFVKKFSNPQFTRLGDPSSTIRHTMSSENRSSAEVRERTLSGGERLRGGQKIRMK